MKFMEIRPFHPSIEILDRMPIPHPNYQLDPRGAAMVGPGTMNTSAPISRLAYGAARWFLGILFIHAGITKLADPTAFARVVDAYGMLPAHLVGPVAVGLPLLEVLAGLGLTLDIRGSLSLISGMVLLFLAVLGYAIALGMDVDCGCFGPEDPEAELFHGLRPAFVRDLGLLALCGFIYLWRRHRGILPRPLPFPPRRTP